MIELKDICIEYDRVILDYASISIPAHSITLIRGKSGSGKTALLYCIALMDTKSKYQYYYDHHLIEEKDRNNTKNHLSRYKRQNKHHHHQNIHEPIMFHIVLYIAFIRKE